jgi:hypothetical protein
VQGSGAVEKKSSEQEDVEVLLGCGESLRKRVRRQQVCELLIRSLLKIRNKEGRLIRLLPNRAQKEFSTRFSGRSIVLKARQMGITTWVAAQFFVSTITKRGTLTVLVAHDQQSAQEIFRIVHRFWENLPKRLRKGALRTSRANVRQLVFPALDSEYRVETAADPDAGRGLTIQNLHGSEVARWPGDAAGTLASLRAAVTPKGEVVLESTARGAVGCFYNEWQRAKDTGYKQHFFPWWWEEMYTQSCVMGLQNLSAEERELKDRHGLSDGQIVYRREILASFLGLAKQEFAEDAESCFLLSGECMFDAEAIEKRLAECSGGGVFQPSPQDKVTVWGPPLPGREYIIGVDSAGGGSDGDYACAEVIDRATGLQCAELHGHMTPEELARRVAQLGRKYNNGLLVVESNNQGREVLAYFRTKHSYDNVFADKPGVGFLTTWRSKPDVVAAMRSAISEVPESLNSLQLLRELRTFVLGKSGLGEAAAGTHDDCVMAMGIALRVRELTAGKHRGLMTASLPAQN